MESKIIEEDLQQHPEKGNQRRTFFGFLLPAVLLLVLFLVPLVLAGITWYKKGELPAGLYKGNASGEPLVLSFYRTREGVSGSVNVGQDKVSYEVTSGTVKRGRIYLTARARVLGIEDVLVIEAQKNPEGFLVGNMVLEGKANDLVLAWTESGWYKSRYEKALELYQKARANSEEAERSLDLARSEYRKKTQEYIAEVSAQCQARRRAVEKEYLSKVTALEAEKERILNRKWSLDSVTDYRAAEIDFQVAEIDYQIADLVSERDQKLMQLEELERRGREEAEVKARKESGIENVQQRCDEAQKALDEAEAHLYRVEFLLDTGRE